MSKESKDWWQTANRVITSRSVKADRVEENQIWRIPIPEGPQKRSSSLPDFLFLYVLNRWGNSAQCAVIHSQEHLALVGDADLPGSSNPLGLPYFVACDLVGYLPARAWSGSARCLGRIMDPELIDRINRAIVQAGKARSSPRSPDWRLFNPETGRPEMFLGFLPRRPDHRHELDQYRTRLATGLKIIGRTFQAEPGVEKLVQTVMNFTCLAFASRQTAGGLGLAAKSGRGKPRPSSVTWGKSMDPIRFLSKLFRRPAGITDHDLKEFRPDLDQAQRDILRAAFVSSAEKLKPDTRTLFAAYSLFSLGEYEQSKEAFIELLASRDPAIKKTAKLGAVWTAVQAGREEFARELLKSNPRAKVLLKKAHEQGFSDFVGCCIGEQIQKKFQPFRR